MVSSPTPTIELQPTPTVPLAEVVGNVRLEITGLGYELRSEYTDESGVMSLTPQRRENELLIVLFEVTNPTDSVQSIDVLGANPRITLYYGNNQSVSARMTMLEADFQYLSQDIAAGEAVEGLLLFEVPKDIVLAGARLAVRTDIGLFQIILE